MQNKAIIIINGPNLNLLGKREKELYGNFTLEDLKTACYNKAKSLNLTIDFRQSNKEYELIEWIQQAEENNFDGIIINPAAYSHTSIAILDALLTLSIPVIEVHLSDIFAREDFRQKLITSLAAKKIISGQKIDSYLQAINEMKEIFSHRI